MVKLISFGEIMQVKEFPIHSQLENLEYALALHFMNYSFYRIHQTLRVTPAMEAGITDHAWEVIDILGLINKTS